MYVKGTYNAICDVCGRQHKANQMLRRWDGLFVCNADWEPRHELDFGRVIIDKQLVDDPAPEPDPIYIEVNYITPPE